MTRFLIKPNKDYEGQYEIWIKYPWWDLLNRDVLPLIACGTINQCLVRIHTYAKTYNIYKYKITVKRF